MWLLPGPFFLWTFDLRTLPPCYEDFHTSPHEEAHCREIEALNRKLTSTTRPMSDGYQLPALEPFN